MNIIKDQTFGGERPLFGIKDTRLENIVITDGESGIKCCENIEAVNCKFYGKYPLWHVNKSLIEDCYFDPGSRSAIWYSDDMVMRNCLIDAPKLFREMHNLTLENVTINDADETFWGITNLRATNLKLYEGTYPFMHCDGIYVDGLESDSKYVFQYCRNVEVHNAKITTKDSFWECENVTVYDSVLDGEYLAWHSKNVRLVRCHIAGEQPLCYLDGITLEECTFDAACDRAFEDSKDINADIKGSITEIKNPISGTIKAQTIMKTTYDEFAKSHSCNIITAILMALFMLPMTMLAGNYPTKYGDLPFNMPEVVLPTIPSNTLSVTDFGAKGDGETLCTEAFAKAMKSLAQRGGGRLTVPAGIWLTGPIELLDNCELHVEQGALVLFTTDYNAYPDINTIYEGNSANKKMAPLYARNRHDIAITGTGTFDGQGQAWRPSKKGKFTDNQWKALTGSISGVVVKNVFYPDVEGNRFGGNEGTIDERRVMHRPVLLEFIECKKVLLQDATFSNSPAWNVHPLKCEDVTIDHCNIRNPWYAQNGDGLDLESCTRAHIKNTTFDVGDDAICIKSGKDAEGRSWKMPCQQVLIEDCVVLHGHGGFVIGSEMSSGARDIMVRRCLFNGTDTGLRMKSTRGRGGVVENIHIEDINMVDIAEDAFTFDLYYANKPAVGKADKDTSDKDLVPKVTEETPSFRNLHISNIVCQGARRAIYFNGLPEMPIQNLTISNSLFVANRGAELHYAKDITFNNVTIRPKQGEPITTTPDVTNLIVK